MEEKTIYILLTHTGTYLSRAISMVTKYEYTHVSIALDPELKKLYSFGRKRPRNPIIGGFVKEDIHSGVYSLNPNINCRIYSMKIPKHTYENLKRNIDYFYSCKDDYRYSLLGLFTCALNIPFKRKNSYFCSQFVAHVLELSDIRIFNKPSSLVKPSDFAYVKEFELEYEGLLRHLPFYKEQGFQEGIAI